MPLQEGVLPVNPEDFPQMVEVWEASVRATHDFLTEADIQFFKPLVLEELPNMASMACMRNDQGKIVGILGVSEEKIEMLFIHPLWRGKGVGRQLLLHAVHVLGASVVDVNEQNEQAVGFYLRMGFEVAGRSAVDSLGKPFPLLHLQLPHREGEVINSRQPEGNP